MVEQVYKFTLANTKTVEKIIFDENVSNLQMIFNQDEGLPDHYPNGGD